MPTKRYKIFAPSFSYLKTNAKTIFAAVLPFALVYLGLLVVMSLIPQFSMITVQNEQIMVPSLSYSLLSILQSITLIFFTAWLLALLFKTDPKKNALSYFLRSIGIGLLTFVAVAVPVFLIATITHMQGVLSAVLLIALICTLVYFFIRITFYIPSAMDKKRLSLKEAFAVTKEHVGYLFSRFFILVLILLAVIIAFAIPFSLIGFAVYGSDFATIANTGAFPLWMSLVFEILGLVIAAYATIVLFTLYQAIVHNKGQA